MRKVPAGLLVVAAALLVRLVVVLFASQEVADIALYRRVGEHVLAEGWNPYETRGLYPYPPLWMWVEAAAVWLGGATAVPFAIWIKLPSVAADAWIVGLLAAWGRKNGQGLRPAWAYALHPVALLITGFHGQFDAIPLACVLFAIREQENGKPDRAALALAAGIAVKSFPVLLVPFFLVGSRSWREALRFLVLSTVPVAFLLAPFALANFTALRRELLGYSGIADFGWIGFLRGVRWLVTDHLTRSEPQHWGALPTIAKGLFLSTYALLFAAFVRNRLSIRLADACLAVFLAFQAFYGAVSAQYLLWVVPFGARRPSGLFGIHAATATLALIGFYAFFHPGVLTLNIAAATSRTAGMAWVAGTGAVLLASLVWFASVLRSTPHPDAEQAK